MMISADRLHEMSVHSQKLGDLSASTPSASGNDSHGHTRSCPARRCRVPAGSQLVRAIGCQGEGVEASEG